MMRSLLVALFVLAPVTQADPELTITSLRTNISIGEGAFAVVRNASASEEARNVAVEIVAGAGLELEPFAANSNWTCAPGKTRSVCTVARMAPGEDAGFLIRMVASDRTGGHRRLDMNLTAQNAAAKSLTFDVIVPRESFIGTEADFGVGSLRAAIEDINASPVCGAEVPCNIYLLPAVTLIAPETPLPAICKCNVEIASTDPSRETKPAAISGENATYGNGLEIRTPVCPSGIGGVSIHGLAIHSWPWNGIAIEGESDGPGLAYHVITRVYVGTDRTGLVARPNGARGVVVDAPHVYLHIGGAILSANGRSGLALFRGVRAEIDAMRIGTGRDGRAMGNGASGIFSWGVPFHVIFSIIAHNAHAGVAVTKGTPAATIRNNAIHSNGGIPIDWGLDDRTPPDDADTDGVPNTPRILDAFYDAGSDQTIVRGTLRLHSVTFNDVYVISVFEATSPRGDVVNGQELGSHSANAPANATDLPFEIAVRGDYRGKLLAAQYEGVSGVNVSSEMSEAVTVR